MKNKYQVLVGKKVGMTQIILDNGDVIPVTVVKSTENVVYRHRTQEKDGYNSICVGYSERKPSKLSKPHFGQFKGDLAFQYSKEFRVDSFDNYKLNSKIDLSIFEVGLKYSLQSKSKGCGFSGAIKVHNHQRGPMSHGSKNHRLMGSIGQATTPGRVFKGKRMPKKYGDQLVTVQNLELIKIDGLYLFFKGSVPGKKGFVFITGENK